MDPNQSKHSMENADQHSVDVKLDLKSSHLHSSSVSSSCAINCVEDVDSMIMQSDSETLESFGWRRVAVNVGNVPRLKLLQLFHR